MAYNWYKIVKEEYKGYQIIKKRHALGGGYTNHFSIYKDDEPVSTICLISPQACKNVIDTYVRALKDKELPIIVS